jgi:FdhE protein
MLCSVTPMPETWDQRIRRALDLARDHEQARTLLAFYAELLTVQKQLYARFKAQLGKSFSGELEAEVAAVAAEAPPLLHAVVMHGPVTLAAAATQLLEADGALENLLLDYWHHPSDRDFFAKSILQPYAQSLAENGIRREGDSTSPHRCPMCGGSPQVSVLDKSETIDGAGRRLVCARCFTQWPCRRVVCVNCGEEDERQLAYFDSPSFAHLRVDGCDTCKRYLKTVDRTRLGLAVPVVDEVAGASLDLWARERGYQKIELNLVGL